MLFGCRNVANFRGFEAVNDLNCNQLRLLKVFPLKPKRGEENRLQRDLEGVSKKLTMV
jgi:hypothetical protein